MLDPELDKVVEFFSRRPRLKDMSVSQARALSRDWIKLAPRSGVPLNGVEDGAFAGREGNVRIRMYLPLQTVHGTVVFYHGGGFVLGDLDTHDEICRLLAHSSECRVISVDYRLAPEHRFPAAVTDAHDALKWAVDTCGGKLVVAGDSAGGNLAAVVTQLAKKDELREPRLQALIYPALNLMGLEPSIIENYDSPFLAADDMRWFWEKYLASPADASDLRASPILEKDLTGLPRALILTAEHDPLRDQGELYSALLRRSGVSVLGVRYSGVGHGFLSLPLATSRDAIRQIGEFVRSRLSQS